MAEAMEALATRTEQGVRRGLRLLGLPQQPLHFVPGAELRLRGHDVRVAVCRLMTHWAEGDRVAFRETLARVRRIVETQPKERDGEVLQRREELRQERRRLQQRLRGVEEQLEAIEEKLKEPGGPGSACEPVGAPSGRWISVTSKV